MEISTQELLSLLDNARREGRMEKAEEMAMVRSAPAIVPGCGNVSPREVDPDKLASDIATLVSRPNKITAIKLYRTITGAGLNESKAAIERFWPF